jgi:hypothetical protein
VSGDSLDFGSFITDQLLEIQKKENKELDEFILKFFGSVEAAQEFGHLFVLEIFDEDEGVVTDPSDKNKVMYHRYATYRIRRKTE